MIAGIVLGVASATIWATSSLAVKAQAARVHPVSFNAFRLIVASLFFLVLLPFFGGWDAVAEMSFDTRLALTSSTIAGIVIGDTLYFWSMTQIGASRALPISGIYPLFTWAIAVPLLDEPITWRAMIGTALVLISLVLLAPVAQDEPSGSSKLNRAGVLAAIGAAACWAIGTTALKFGLQEGVNLVVLNAFRLPLGALVLVLIMRKWKGAQMWNGYRRDNLPVLTALAWYSTALGAIVFILVVEYVGAARAALLNTVAPVIGIPLSIIFLRERVTLKLVIGALLSISGIVLILWI